MPQKISALAEKSRAKKQETGFKFPRPMINSGDLNFSYSGLKTAVLYKLKADGREDEEYKEDIARAFEDAAVEVLVEKTRKALEDEEGNIKTLIVGGGVASNKHLSGELEGMMKNFPAVTLRIPERSLTTDNALMIGIAAYVRVSKEPSILDDKTKILAKGNLSL